MSKFLYDATVARVIDGDTVVVDISLSSLPAPGAEGNWWDLGFDFWINRPSLEFAVLDSQALQFQLRNQRIRLYGINAPELHSENPAPGIAAREYLRSLVEGKQVKLKTFQTPIGDDKREKYGRFLGELIMSGNSINKKMLDAGLAKPFMV